MIMEIQEKFKNFFQVNCEVLGDPFTTNSILFTITNLIDDSKHQITVESSSVDYQTLINNYLEEIFIANRESKLNEIIENAEIEKNRLGKK